MSSSCGSGPRPATTTACNPRGTRPMFHCFCLTAMTTIAMERAGSRRGGGWSLPAIPVDTAFVPDGRPNGASTVRPQVMQAGTTVTVGKILDWPLRSRLAEVAYGSLGTMIHMAHRAPDPSRPGPPTERRAPGSGDVGVEVLGQATTDTGHLAVGSTAVQPVGWVHGVALSPRRACIRLTAPRATGVKGALADCACGRRRASSTSFSPEVAEGGPSTVVAAIRGAPRECPVALPSGTIIARVDGEGMTSITGNGIVPSVSGL
jgi:hypothetical protein